MIGLASRPFVAVALVAFSCVGLAFSGCGDSGSTTDDPPDECVGGVIVEGVCEGKCDSSKCLENNVCVGNRCLLQCTDHEQCFSPAEGDPTLQECAPQQQDTEAGLNDGDAVLVCTNISKPLRTGLGCPFGTECEASDDYACPNGTRCTSGEDSDACSAAECKPLVCLGTGEGDADAYCTNVDCTEDAHCGPGMYCGIVRSSTQICGTMKGDEGIHETNAEALKKLKPVKEGGTVNESCTSCHGEKRGPHLWEHPPVTESCSTCHDPHGSNNDRMLVAKQPFLCQRCHVTSRHPPTVYEGFLLKNSQNANKIFGRSCVVCHQMVHGSNSPNGRAFLR